jgi:heat shock protein HslJ
LNHNRFNIFLFTFLFLIYTSCRAQNVKVSPEKKLSLSNEWVLTGFYNDGGKLIYDSTKSAELVISPDQKFFTGNTGCNAMRGEIKTEDDGKIKIGPVESNRKRCPNSEKEKRFLEALQCVTDYKIDGAFLNLFCNEKLVLQFECYKN